MRPLAGITVVSLEQAIAAPLATRHLAELGARVIKVERPVEGDFARRYDTRARGLSSHFVWTNRSKESLTLDLKNPDARTLLRRLIVDRADVLVQNLAPGAVARLGFGYESLARDQPRLIVCDISGYGADGPYRDKKAYDLLIQAEAGLVGIMGTASEPAKAGIPAADIAAGMYAYSSILAALLERHATGTGKHLDISMFESLLEWMGYPLYYAMDGASPPARSGASHATIYPYGPFATGDGNVVMLGIQNEREWDSLCANVLGDPDLAHDPRFADATRRSDARNELKQIIESAFATRTVAQVVKSLDAAQIANSVMNTLAEVWDHPQLAARRRWSQVETPQGTLPALAPPGASADDARMDPVPGVGEHTDAILRELGCTDDDIGALRDGGAI